MLQHGPTEEQQVYLHMCLDIMLEISLGSKIDPDTLIFEDEENPEENYCTQHLEDLFLRKYPLATRRYNYNKGNDYVHIHSHAKEKSRRNRHHRSTTRAAVLTDVHNILHRRRAKEKNAGIR